MRVCHVWHNFFPIEFGGAERYILSLSDFLFQQDQNLHFLLITDRAAYVPLQRALRTSRCQQIDSLEVHRLGPNFSSFLGKAFSRTFHRSSKSLDDLLAINLFREAANIQGMDQVDVFHVHGFWQSLYPTIGLHLSQHFHRPLVVTLHGDSVNFDDPYAMPIKAPETIHVLENADVITTYSHETLKILEDFKLGKKRVLVPNFVDTKLFQRRTGSEDSSGNNIVMITRLSKPKDPMTPIRAFAQVRKEIPDVTLKIVGYGPLYEYANRLVQDLSLQGAVTFYGAKSDVRDFLWSSDIFIGTRGSYITTLEAWAAGLAVVAPDFGIMKEIISSGKNGLLSTPGDANQLAYDLISLINDKRLRATIIENGMEALKKHDIRNVAPSIKGIYYSLL